MRRHPVCVRRAVIVVGFDGNRQLPSCFYFSNFAEVVQLTFSFLLLLVFFISLARLHFRSAIYCFVAAKSHFLDGWSETKESEIVGCARPTTFSPMQIQVTHWMKSSFSPLLSVSAVLQPFCRRDEWWCARCGLTQTKSEKSYGRVNALYG